MAKEREFSQGLKKVQSQCHQSLLPSTLHYGAVLTESKDQRTEKLRYEFSPITKLGRKPHLRSPRIAHTEKAFESFHDFNNVGCTNGTYSDETKCNDQNPQNEISSTANVTPKNYVEQKHIISTDTETIRIRKEYITKYDEYESIYQSKLKTFQTLNPPKKCILTNTINDEDTNKYITDHHKFALKYKLAPQVLNKSDYQFTVAKKINTTKDYKYFVKSYAYKTTNDITKAAALLSRWIAMKKIGIIEDGEICINQQNRTIRLVMKLWDASLGAYITKNSGDNNIFRKKINIALFMKDIVEQLKTIHDNGMVYCDVKPGNIGMDIYKNRNNPKSFGLIYYGLLSKNHQLIPRKFGTPCYRPSEMQEYKGYNVCVTDKWDVFSLGITLLELMDGRHPFKDDLIRWNKALRNLKSDKLRFDIRSLHLFMDQDVLNKCIESNVVLNENGDSEFFIKLKDLIVNMINDDFSKRYSIDDVINHPWFDRYCVWTPKSK